ncbi:MAG: hypothetical protein AAB428_01475 [Patescibacteria group bacterium]
MIPPIPQSRKSALSAIEIEEGNTCRASLFSAPESAYGQKYKEDLFAQYKLFVESVSYTSDIKLKVNSYFLTINTALITATGISFSKQLDSSIWHLLLPLAGLLVSVIWWGVTYSYKQRNIVKLRIIHCIEEKMPLALYSTEWQLMNEKHSGFLKKFLFTMDLFTPLVFAISYLLFIFLN